MDESLGKFLASSRISRGLSVSEVAGTTRINEKFIRHVEDDRFDLLPGDVFVKGFLRAYATQLRLDGDRLVERYVALDIEHSHQAPEWISMPLHPKSSRLPLVGLIIILMGLAVFAYYRYQESGMVFPGSNGGISPEALITPIEKKMDLAPEGKENENITADGNPIMPEEAKVIDVAPTDDKKNLAEEKKPLEKVEPKIKKPVKKKKTRVNR